MVSAQLPMIGGHSSVTCSVTLLHYKRSHSQTLSLVWGRVWGVTGARQTS